MKLYRFLSLIILVTAMNGCAVLLHNDHELFSITDLYYQSWMTEGQEKGTGIYAELRDVDRDIEFTKLVFRGIEVDISMTEKGSKVFLKATVNTGPSLIENYDYEVTGQPDMLRYRYRGKEYEYPLKSIRREQTKFNGKK